MDHGSAPASRHREKSRLEDANVEKGHVGRALHCDEYGKLYYYGHASSGSTGDEPSWRCTQVSSRLGRCTGRILAMTPGSVRKRKEDRMTAGVGRPP